MDAILNPTERLHDALNWFLAAGDLRLFYAQTSEALRLPMLSKLASVEGNQRCPRPVVILEAGVEEGDDGWDTRTEELAVEMESARERAGKADPALVIRPFPSPVPSRPPIAGFARALRTAIDCVQLPLEGLLVVLAPIVVEDASVWRETVGALVARPELAKARFVVIDPEDGPALTVAQSLGRLAEIADGRIDRNAAAAGLAAMVASMASASPGSEAARAAGLAGPREPPPRRIRQPAPLSAEAQVAAMAAVGLPPAYADGALMQRIRLLVLEAAKAMGEGRASDAIRSQREARDLAERAGLSRESVLFEIMMGSYALQAGAPDAALRAFEAAAGRAIAARFPELAAQAFLAKGGALLVGRKTDQAAVAYAEAGKLAADKLPALAIEGYRLAGSLLASLRQEQQAIAVWNRALEIAGALQPNIRGATSASEVARAVAAVCRKHGLRAQAAALEAQAVELESPPAETATGST